MSGHKKVSDFLVDSKVSLPDKRRQFVVVSDGAEAVTEAETKAETTEAATEAETTETTTGTDNAEADATTSETEEVDLEALAAELTQEETVVFG